MLVHSYSIRLTIQFPACPTGIQLVTAMGSNFTHVFLSYILFGSVQTTVAVLTKLSFRFRPGTSANTVDVIHSQLQETQP